MGRPEREEEDEEEGEGERKTYPMHAFPPQSSPVKLQFLAPVDAPPFADTVLRAGTDGAVRPLREVEK